MNIIVLSLRKTDALLANDIMSPTITHIVSIGDKKVRKPVFLEAHPAKTLRLIFDDVSFNRQNLQGPTDKDIENLIEFFKSADKDSKFLIHCVLGQSRSTAAALVLLYILNSETAVERLLEIAPQAIPNSMILKKADKLLKCNGKLIKAGEYIVKQNEA